MGQNILKIEHGMDSASLDTNQFGGLSLLVQRDSYELTGCASVSLSLTEEDARALREALDEYIGSRELKFEEGDIVYEPNHYKRAGEVTSILEDRIFYGAPYRIRFIDQDPRQPATDYFPADGLVLVQKKADRKDA